MHSALLSKIWPLVAVFLIGMQPNAAHAQRLPPHCGALANAYGPWEYRADRFIPPPMHSMTHTAMLRLVEGAHFTPEVEMLFRGASGKLGDDIDYTLRAFPNHHRALVSMMRYGERLKVNKVPHAKYDVECYFLRALAFQPDDTTARMLYVTYLKQQGRTKDALQQLAVTETHAGDNAFTHYNMGLLYMDLGEPASALKHAHIAQARGFLRTDLKNKLVAAGRWAEPAAAAASEPVAAPASAPVAAQVTAPASAASQ